MPPLYFAATAFLLDFLLNLRLRRNLGSICIVGKIPVGGREVSGCKRGEIKWRDNVELTPLRDMTG